MISRHHHNKHRFSLSLLLFVITSSFINIAYATNYDTIQDGDWSSATTWDRGLVPDANLAGDKVFVRHNVVYNAGSDLFIETGLLEVSGILDIPNFNLKMVNSSVVNIDSGLIIIGNDNFENTGGKVNFSYGAVQLCNGTFTNGSASSTDGEGYIYAANGNIEDTTASSFSNNIAWCSDAGGGIGLPTVENCTVAKPLAGCTDTTHFTYNFSHLDGTYKDKDGKTLICHYSSSGSHTIDLSTSALETHLFHHGDSDGPCSPTTVSPVDLTCPVGYKLETWPAAAPGSTIFDSSNGLLRLTASTNFTNATHPGIGGIRTSTANAEVSETIKIRSIDKSVLDIENLRVLVYDLDSETSSDQDYAYITFTGVNIVANSMGSNVEMHPTIPNAYMAILNSGGGSGADDSYHASFVVNEIKDKSTITMTSGYTGTGSESFVGYQACILTSRLSITGKVFKDANSNDVFDSDETGIADISVWLQAINANGTIDPVKVPVVTDTLGNYQLRGLADGNYQVHVDIADTDLPTGHSIGSTNPLVITISGTDVTDVDFAFDEMVCTAFTGEVNEAALPISSQLKTTDKLFVPSKSISPINGHLRAYGIDDYGVAASTASWDAAILMSAANRNSNLYSTDASGKKVAFNALDDVAFFSNTLPVATIKAYTIDPSTDGGTYLAGRESGSFLGGISKGSELDILSSKINTSLYLTDTKYREFYSKIVAIRNQSVLMSSDDGFLYAFDYSTGNLVWAWMPRTIVSELADYTNYQSKHLMAGTVDILDLPDGGGKYDTYVVGSYKNGLGHYVLKLKDDGTLDKVIWDDDQSASFNKSPNNGEMEFFKDGSGKTFAAYVLANDAAASRLKIKSLADSSEDMSVDLNYQASSTPFVMPDYGKNNAPANKTLYLGSTNGDIHAGKVLESDGSLSAASDIQAYLQASSVTSMAESASDPVLYIDSSVSAKNSLYYLSSQTATRLTLHRYKASNTSWNKAWTSYSSGAGSWDDSGTYSADSSGVPSKGADGFNIIPPTGIQSLPVDATITAKAVIVGDSVVLPLSVLPAGSSACYGKAYYYLYSLSDGVFPANTFFNNDGTEIITDIALGYGEAKQLSITDMAGTNKLLGFGMADKKADLTSGIAKSFVIKDPVAVGIRGWKEIGR